MTAPAARSSASTTSPGPRELHVEELVGRRVRDVDGRKIGHIEELIAEIRGTDWVVVEVHLGAGALLERLVDLSTLVPVLGRFTQRARRHYCLSWSQLDVTDP